MEDIPLLTSVSDVNSGITVKGKSGAAFSCFSSTVLKKWRKIWTLRDDKTAELLKTKECKNTQKKPFDGCQLLLKENLQEN